MRTGISWLDVRLGVRMLVKHPALTLVGGLGMAVAIALGAGSYAFFNSYLHPTLPLHEGERVVGIENWDAAWNDQEPRSLHDFVTWREELKSVQELGAFRTVERNLIAPDGQAEPVPVAEMTASGFRVARVPALLGRLLLEEDEREGAPPVAVIGFEVWRTRFASDPAVVGREVRLGSTVHTVVGVMPEGFAFPVSHRFWVPLRANPLDYARRQGPDLTVFGRLAPGATLGGARAELAALGRRTAAAFPETHARLRPRVVPYTALWSDEWGAGEMRLVQLLVTLLLVVVCANVASLVYARTATRQGEIVVRSALGASRLRIVAQLFAEALVLSAAAAAAGLGLATAALRLGSAFMERQPGGGTPFWVDFGLSPGTVVYVLALTLLGAVIVGVVPALGATGRRLESSLRQLGGGTGMRLGRTWTALIVAQVAFAVAVLPAAVYMGWQWVRYAAADPGFAAGELLTARLAMDRETPPSAEAAAYRREAMARYGRLQAELARRLEAEPGVSGVTFSGSRPGAEPTVFVEVEGVAAPVEAASRQPVRSGSAGHEVRRDRVDDRFFDVFGVPVLAGRRFHAGDLEAAATAVVVNRTFVRQVLGGGSAVGRRVRYVGLADDDEHVGAAEPGPWHEIVGVVGNLPANAMQPGTSEARLYHPLAPGGVQPATLTLRMRAATPAAVAGRLREVTTALDPTLRLRDVATVDEALRQEQAGMRMAALAVAVVTLSVLLLSAAGIYALMSFAVARRRREIGIRSALGADPRRLLASVFSRALGQLAVGLAAGVAAAALLEQATGGELMNGEGAVVLPAVAALMVAVGLLAAIGPARRGLSIEPSEALRSDG